MRRKEYSNKQVADLFWLFGIDIARRLEPCLSHRQKLEVIDQAKKDAKEKYLKLAFENHPDRGGDEERLKGINAAWETIQQLRFNPERPRPPQTPTGFGVVRIVVDFGSGSTSTSTTTTSFW